MYYAEMVRALTLARRETAALDPYSKEVRLSLILKLANSNPPLPQTVAFIKVLCLLWG